ncbi:MAG: hypothetical protein D6803_06230 [Anaerolineae bacterium]|nr:MAG: hypothetical protein D6803_06230 [Anaerolineae bacterium]
MSYWQHTLSILFLLLAAVISAITAWLVWQRRKASAAVPLSALMLATALWAGGYALELNSATLGGKLFWAKVQYLGVATTPTLLLWFALQFAGWLERPPKRLIALLAAEPVIILLLFWTNDYHRLYWRAWSLVQGEVFVTMSREYGVLFWVHLVYTYLALGASVLILLIVFLRTQGIYRQQSALLLGSILVGWVAQAMFVFLQPVPGLNFTPFTFAITGTAITWALFRKQLLALPPLTIERFVAPHPSLLTEESRRRARILASILAVVIPLLFVELLRSFRNPEILLVFGPATLLLAIAFALSRSPFYQYGVWLTLLTLSAIPTASTFTLSGFAPARASDILIWMVPTLIVGSLLLRPAGLIVLSALDLTLLALTPALHSQIAYSHIWPALALNLSAAILLIGAANIHTRDIQTLEKQNKELAQARDQAQAANRLKSQILANVSHDMRTPLGAIIGYVDMLREQVYGPLTEAQHEKLTATLQSANQLMDFIQNLLEQARLAAGEVEIKRQPLNLARLLTEVDATVRVQAEQKGLRYSSAIAAELPETILGDAYWIRRILSNLISNAIKFTPQGEIQVWIGSAGNGEWQIQVADTGIGIAPESQEAIFEPFFRGEAVGQGAGLGLAIIHDIVEKLGGRVEVRSAPGAGSRFTVYLPLNPAR